MTKPAETECLETEGRLLWVMALAAEAKPVIRQLRLKKTLQETRFPLYENKRHALIVSGTGKTKAAIAATYLMSREPNPCALINFGLCASRDASLTPGKLILPDQVIDRDTGMRYYPDLFFSSQLSRCTLECHPGLVRDTSDLTPEAACADMESAGIMEASRRFLKTHQVLLLKVISDPMQPSSVKRQDLPSLLQEAMGQLDGILLPFAKQARPLPDFIAARQNNLMQSLQSLLHLTVSQRQDISRLLHRALLAGLGEDTIRSFFPRKQPATKSAAKAALQQMKERLNHALSHPLH